MQRITLDNFRVFGMEANFDLAPVTVLTGKNNSGKSSLIKAFLVLADYLEQDDQTVLRLDGIRAVKHKISTFTQLANWTPGNRWSEKEAGRSVRLGYSKGQYEFSYEFDPGEDQQLGSNNAPRTASLKQFTMRLKPLDLALTLVRNARMGGHYELSVNQQFIDYVTDEQGREVTRAFQSSVGDEERLAWLKSELSEVSAKLEESTGKWLKSAQGAHWQNNPHSSDFTELTTKKQKLEAQVKSMGQFVKRQAKSVRYTPQIQLAGIDGGTPTLTRIVQHGLLKYIEEDNARAAKQFKFGKGGERKVLVSFIQRMGHLMQFQPYHLGPNRTYQARLVGGLISEGEIAQVAEEYVRHGTARGERAQDFLARWMKNFGIGSGITVAELEGAAYGVSVKRNNGIPWTNLADLGFGSGQLVCILLMIATNIQRKEQGVAERFLSFQHSIILLIEEPEANLHPNLQSLLAELFLEVTQQYGFQLIIETHSEYLIRNVQVLVKGQHNSDAFKVYYLAEPTQSNPGKYGHEMLLREDGAFLNKFGEGFLDVARKLAFEVL